MAPLVVANFSFYKWLAGEYLEFDESIFESQILIPSLDVVNVSSQEGAPSMDAAVNRSIAHLKNKLSNVLDKTPDGKRKSVFREQNDPLDDDDFVVRETRSGSHILLLLLRRGKILPWTQMISLPQGGPQENLPSGVSLLKCSSLVSSSIWKMQGFLRTSC